MDNGEGGLPLFAFLRTRRQRAARYAMSQASLPSPDFLHVPLAGVAAYWLALRKLVGNAKSLKSLEDELHFVAEPFVGHLLALALSDLSPARMRQAAAVSARAELFRVARQFDFMRIAVLDIAQAENPLRTLARMLALFPTPPDDPEGILEQAQDRLQRTTGRQAPREIYLVSNRLNDEALCTTLLFYAVMARKHGKAASRPFLAQAGSSFFVDALALVVDGFDTPFVRKWMKKAKESILSDFDRKVALSVDLCEALRERLPFESMQLLAKSHLR